VERKKKPCQEGGWDYQSFELTPGSCSKKNGSPRGVVELGLPHSERGGRRITVEETKSLYSLILIYLGGGRGGERVHSNWEPETGKLPSKKKKHPPVLTSRVRGDRRGHPLYCERDLPNGRTEI